MKKYVLFYTYPCIYYLQSSLFFCIDSAYHPWSLPFSWKTLFCIFYSVYLFWQWILSVIVNLKNNFILPSFFKNIFNAWRMLGCICFFLCTSELLHCSLTSIVSNKSELSFVLSFLCIYCVVFPWLLLRCFFPPSTRLSAVW